MDHDNRYAYRGPIKAVVLDWAGTTVDYGSWAPTAVFMRLFLDQGVVIGTEDARTGMGLMKKDHLEAILARPAVAKAWRKEHGVPASDADVDNLFHNFVPMQISILKEYAQPIPGLSDVIAALHGRNIKIGSTTGYTREMMDILASEAEKRGYTPDCIVCPDEVPAGRPYPWMCYQNAIQLGVFPMQAMAKVGDTLVDIDEGKNAGMWTVGLSLTGNLLGLSEAEVNGLSSEKRDSMKGKIEQQLYHAGAHVVIDGIWDLPSALDDIESRIVHGEHP